MSEQLIIQGETKQERYEALLPQIQSVVEGEPDLIANMANVEGQELALCPFQGPLPCTRIRTGRGVCGTAWAKAETQVVPDVDKFPGHIACSSASRSEIVVPVFHEGRVVAVLDIDSERLSTFDETDRRYLEQVTFFLSTIQ